MGLSAKNAILMVEFAERAEREGKRVIEAAIEAARIRLRPILMTSFAFIFGVMPLALATGAGANSRAAIGTAVIGGMLTATILAVFYIPFFFVLVRRSVRDGVKVSPRTSAAAEGGAGVKRCAAVLALLATACATMEPKLGRPDPAIPPSWPAGESRRSSRPKLGFPPSPTGRSSRIRDCRRLIAQALVNNRDLMMAASNIAAAREQYRIQRAQQLPQVDAQAGATVDRRQDRTTSARNISSASGPELRNRPVRPAALADARTVAAISRDRSRRARDAPDAGRGHRQRLAQLCRGLEPASDRAADGRQARRRASD